LAKSRWCSLSLGSVSRFLLFSLPRHIRFTAVAATPATPRTTATPRDTATPPPFFCSTPHIFTVARTLAVKTSTTNYTVN